MEKVCGNCIEEGEELRKNPERDPEVAKIFGIFQALRLRNPEKVNSPDIESWDELKIDPFVDLEKMAWEVFPAPKLWR